MYCIAHPNNLGVEEEEQLLVLRTTLQNLNKGSYAPHCGCIDVDN